MARFLSRDPRFPAGAALGVMLALSALLGGCGEPAPQLQPVGPDAVILAFGDSLTHGTGAGRGQSYPEVLAAISGRQVINAGVSGELSADGLARLPALLERYQPQLVLLCHGGNDMLRKRDLGQAAQNLIDMIALARSQGAQVVLIGVPRPGLILGTAEWYARVAEETRVPLETEIFAKVLAKASLKSDPVHPNGAGYRQVAERLNTFLHQAGAW